MSKHFKLLWFSFVFYCVDCRFSNRVKSVNSSLLLTKALFYGSGKHYGSSWKSQNSLRKFWSEIDDRKWRMTTKAPYFENKFPGSEKYLPAAAVLGAAIAFNLVTLLPLNVPPNKPLLHCNDVDVEQINIKIQYEVYFCSNGIITYRRYDQNYRPRESQIYISNQILYSHSPLVCNSTTTDDFSNEKTLFCYLGSLPEISASFIPTSSNFLFNLTAKEFEKLQKIHKVWIPNRISTDQPKTKSINITTLSDGSTYISHDNVGLLLDKMFKTFQNESFGYGS